MIKNFGISLAVIALLYTLLESSFLWWFPRVVPAGGVAWLDEGIQPLAQSSKRGVGPKDYIALAGDSYAEGMGDWASAEMDKPMARYHSAHLLQDATGRDVISFGSAGAGSVRSVVTEPLSQLAYMRRYTFRSVPDPAVMLVYFYEGNDLYDNLSYYRYSFPRLFDESQQFDPVVYQQYLQQFSLEQDPTWRKAQRQTQRQKVTRHLHFARLLRTVYYALRGIEPSVDPDVDGRYDPPWAFGAASYREPGTLTRARINGQDVLLPDWLQSPAVDLDGPRQTQAWFALEQSLLFARRALPDTQLVLVYIPSVLSVYTLSSDGVSVQGYEGKHPATTAVALRESSNVMRARFQTIARQQGLPMIDTTLTFQAAAKTAALHGPSDWNHLNEKGYRVLAAEVARFLDAQRFQ